MISIKKLVSEDWRAWRAIRIEALRESPHAFSTALADWQGEGDSERRWRHRLDSVPFNVVAHVDGVVAGMVSGTSPSPDGEVLLISMYVAPFARGSGVGDALVNAVKEWAVSQRADRVALAVMEANAPAIALYRRNGFIDSGAGMPGQRVMVVALDGGPTPRS